MILVIKINVFHKHTVSIDSYNIYLKNNINNTPHVFVALNSNESLLFLINSIIVYIIIMYNIIYSYFWFLLLLKSEFTRSISPTHPLHLYPCIQSLMRGDKITKRRRRQPRPTISNVTCLRAFPGLRVTASH